MRSFSLTQNILYRRKRREEVEEVEEEKVEVTA